jgi:phosphodiesterase/alkaline phosphatase D-like protein
MPKRNTHDQPPDHVRIAFGSCNNQNLTNNLWDVITKREPIAFIWAGDAIYAGKKKIPATK